ncbi:HAD-like protein [Cryphonectria parasitica EP155]|uniref:HAD-like protein n=1 Tax=Cryphonectria parasitica (strain ATCC 38755 / EP155) TaxID=660469 RepID=A0A9P5CSJ1_CRYP1|nr:HAD-like protein [Cryphonectria parasitica EP155]KAF3769353.1 HAD-like protein [Cryphonectria parasitica EP155]
MGYLQAHPRGIIFDLGDVLFTWSANTKTTIPARKLKEIRSRPVWFSYECGQITRDACYELSAQEFSIPASEIAEAFLQARKSLQRNDAIISFLRDLRKDPTIQVYAMSNVGKEDFDELATEMEWALFGQVFTSAAAGMRKPDLGFYSHVLDCIGLAGNQPIFIDDKTENVHAAQALGMRGLTFEGSTIRTLQHMFDGSISRGWKYLFQNAKRCHSITNSGVAFADNFARLLILGSKTTWNFFADEPALIPEGIFPDDLDTTSLALTALQPSSPKTVSLVLDTMAGYVNDDGTFQSRVRERFGMGGNALDLAMRIITCTQMGITCEDDRCALLDMQCEDGGWEVGWLHRYGSTGVKIGNRSVTTAMSIAALSS